MHDQIMAAFITEMLSLIDIYPVPITTEMLSLIYIYPVPITAEILIFISKPRQDVVSNYLKHVCWFLFIYSEFLKQ